MCLRLQASLLVSLCDCYCHLLREFGISCLLSGSISLGTKYLVRLNLDQILEETRNKNKKFSNIDKTNNKWSKQSEMYRTRAEERFIVTRKLPKIDRGFCF